MDRSAARARNQRALSTQSTYEEECESEIISSKEEPDQAQRAEKEEDLNHDTPPTPTNNNLPRARSKANLKLLKRSHAIKESTSPPPDISFSSINSTTIPISSELVLAPVTNNNNNTCNYNNNSSNIGLTTTRPSIKREGSNQSIDSNWSSTLSRGNSIEQQYPDQSGLDIEQFIIDTLHKNTKDRLFLLRIENDLVTFAKDSRKPSYKFGTMSSYQRMLVHRVAHYFGMEHNTDPTGHMVIVTKGKTTRLPDTKFNDFIRDDLLLSEEPRRSILKRDSASFEETGSFKSPDRHTAGTPRRSKSFEEREEEYEKARRRIFHQEQGDHQDFSQEDEDFRWQQLAGIPVWPNHESSDSTRLHPNSHRPSRLTKVESYEGKDTLKANSLRSSISKSHSFGGYEMTPSSRVLTKQDSASSASSRVSPSSSGYKSQSQRSDATLSATPSPTATPQLTTQMSNQSGGQSPEPEQERTVMWAVTNMSSVPPGSVLINPQTQEPFLNEDGTIYRYNPNNPPEIVFNSDFRNQKICSHQNGDMEDVTSNCHTQNQESGPVVITEEQTIPTPPVTPPPQAETPSYHEDDNTDESDTDIGVEPMPVAIFNPPTVVVPPQPQPNPSVYSSSPVMTYPVPGHYHQYMPNSTEPSNPPVVYPPTNPPYAPIPPYDRVHFVEGGSQELCGYLMGLSLGEMGRPEATYRPVFYRPSAPAPTRHPTAHFSQGPPSVPYFYAQQPTTAQPQGPPQPSRYPYNYGQFHAPVDRPGAECPYTQPPMHAYYSRCNSSPQVGAAPTNYCASNGIANNMMGLVQMPPTPIPQVQPPRPYHRLPTPPTTTQNGCSQYPMYNNGYATAMPGCYPHFQPPNHTSQIALTPILRPALQLGMSSSPPLRTTRAPNYNSTSRSPVLREAGPPDNVQLNNPMRFTNAGPHPSLPMYRFSYPANPNEMIMVNGNSRGQFNPSSNNRSAGSNTSTRRNRPRPTGSTPANGRPVHNVGVVSQQAALATAIEAAGGYHLMTTP